MTAATGILALISLAEFVFILVQRIRMRALNDQNLVLRAQVSRFDHDGDGKIGGSKPITPIRPNALHPSDRKSADPRREYVGKTVGGKENTDWRAL